MIEYETQTGYYVIVDDSGEVIGKADVPLGKHLLSDEANPSACFDVDSASDLDDYNLGDTV